MTNEIWKHIPCLPKYYFASNQGRVKRLAHKKMTKKGLITLKEMIYHGTSISKGYLCVHIRPKMYNVHRLVLLAFLKQPKDKIQVNHKNGIKSDNTLKNLEWVTRRENEDHALRTGLKKVYGEYNPMHKLKNHQVLEISRECEFYSDRELAAKYNVKPISIHRIRHKKYWQRLLSNPSEFNSNLASNF